MSSGACLLVEIVDARMLGEEEENDGDMEKDGDEGGGNVSIPHEVGSIDRRLY